MDIQQKELLEKAIRDFKKRFIIVTPDFKILFCNRMPFHSSPNRPIASQPLSEQIIGKRCHKIFYGHEKPCENCAVLAAMETKSPELKQIPCKFMEHDVMPSQYAYPIFSNGQIEAFVSMKFDLPIQKKVEEKLQRSNSFLKNLIKSAVDGVVGADQKGNILIFNEAAEKISGYSAQEAMSSLNIRDLYPKGVAREILRKLRSDKYGGKGKLKQCHVDCIGKDGVPVPINLNASIVYENDKGMATIGFFHDLREELKIKKKLEKTRIQLLQAEKMSSLGELAAGVAHQLNNPLGSIVLFTKLIIEDYELEDNLKNDMERILADAERCGHIVKELLEFTRQTNYQMEKCNVNKALERTLLLLENQTIFHNIEIKKRMFENLPLISANEQQLNHVFMNIILNAAQAMDGKGTLTISTNFLKDVQCLEIRVSDSGPGIPEDILPNIFDPFFTTKDEGQGTGLGLSLVYGIVENHGGVVAAESKPGETTFIIRFSIHGKKSENKKGTERG